MKRYITSLLILGALQPSAAGETTKKDVSKLLSGNKGGKPAKSAEMTPSPIEKLISTFPHYVHVESTHCWEDKMAGIYGSLKDGIAQCDSDEDCGAVVSNGCGENTKEVYLCKVGYTPLPGKSCLFKKANSISESGMSYAKINNKHCYNQSFNKDVHNYSSVAEAKKYCDTDSTCGGVYDNDCISKPGEIYLCNAGFTPQASSKSCIYEKDDTEVVVVASNKTAPKTPPSHEYNVERDVHCYSGKAKHIYSTRNEAMLECDDMTECIGVYDQNCDETPLDIFLCLVGSVMEKSSTKSCVFSKGVKKAVPSTTEETTGEIVDNYLKVPETHCFDGKYGMYSSLNEARAACTKDSKCAAVYDQGCDESAKDIFLCVKPYRRKASTSSCIWEQLDTNGNVIIPTTPAPTIATLVEALAYQKLENVHCRNTKMASSFDSVDTAIATCEVTPKCIGVYDNHCNESPDDIWLCTMGGKYGVSGTGSCIYNKTIFSYSYQKMEGMHCYNHKHAEKFDTLAQAKDNCDMESKCLGVYDQNCDESTQDIFMCESGHVLEKSAKSCVYLRGEKNPGTKPVMWIPEVGMHCFTSKYPELGYKTQHEAKKACLKDKNCYGVYDQECDEEEGDIFLCPVGVKPTASHSGSCIFRKDTNEGYTPAPTTKAITKEPTADPAPEFTYDYDYVMKPLLHCFNNRVSKTGTLVGKSVEMLLYDTLDQAKKECDSNPSCSAVYDQNCDESPGDVFLCHKDGNPTSSGASCIYAKEPKITESTTTYKTHVNRHCFEGAFSNPNKEGKNKNGYANMAQAKKACEEDTTCFGIYDRQCDNTRGSIFLCPLGMSMKESITGSCVMEKLSPNDTWQQLTETHCATKKYRRFRTVDDAKLACMADTFCGFVFDNGCDNGKGDVFLCPVGVDLGVSSLSCTYAKPRGGKTAFPTMAPSHLHIANKYEKNNHIHCFTRKYGLYSTLKLAQAGCDLDPDCGGVYDQSCDESSDDIFLCPKDFRQEKSSTSCVYLKVGDITVTKPPTPTPVGFKKCHGLDKKTCNLKENKAECEWVFMSFCQNINNPWRAETCSDLITKKSCPKVPTNESRKKCQWDNDTGTCKAQTSKKEVKKGIKCKKVAKTKAECDAIKGCKWNLKNNGVSKCKGIVK